VVRSVTGAALADDLVVAMTNQEHGVIARRGGGALDPAAYPVGTLLRVLPNHACATGAQHSAYHVVHGENSRIDAVWSRINGW
jgi:D-serine deaminase-like pyridoxal phosphate-dependent protein